MWRLCHLLIRHVMAHYFAQKVRAYLVFSEAVEIDETKIGAQFYKAVTKCAEFRWVFGLICRKSRVPVMYFVNNRKMRALHSIIKTHVIPGAVVFSDDASQYTIKHGGRSQLCDLGYYHFWVNHSREYVNEKFPFITTCNIERNWCNMKRHSSGVSRV